MHIVIDQYSKVPEVEVVKNQRRSSSPQTCYFKNFLLKISAPSTPFLQIVANNTVKVGNVALWMVTTCLPSPCRGPKARDGHHMSHHNIVARLE